MKSPRLQKNKQKVNKTMKNRNTILTATLLLLGCGGLPCTAVAAPSPPPTQNVNVVNPATNPVPITGTVGVAENAARQAVQQTATIPVLPDGSSGLVTI